MPIHNTDQILTYIFVYLIRELRQTQEYFTSTMAIGITNYMYGELHQQTEFRAIPQVGPHRSYLIIVLHSTHRQKCLIHLFLYTPFYLMTGHHKDNFVP